MFAAHGSKCNSRRACKRSNRGDIERNRCRFEGWIHQTTFRCRRELAPEEGSILVEDETHKIETTMPIKAAPKVPLRSRLNVIGRERGGDGGKK